MIVLWVYTIAIWSNHHLFRPFSSSTGRNHSSSFDAEKQSVTAAAAGREPVTILSVVDDSYLDMAENLFETSIKKHGLVDRHVFASIGTNRTCRAFREIGANCVQEIADAGATSFSEFGTVSFRRKTMSKVELALRILEQNISVFVVDLDIVFFRDPMSYLTSACPMQDCDIVAQFNDGLEGVNTGFYLARPTSVVVSSFLLAINEPKYNNFCDDQVLLNRI